MQGCADCLRLNRISEVMNRVDFRIEWIFELRKAGFWNCSYMVRGECGSGLLNY